ncbi:MAG TPA: response regulator transcription factor [Ktedonobacterales bacterium]|nr:response regulator transcription factor [Ktedonobacterales bacterium]
MALEQTIGDTAPENRMRVLVVESNPAAREGVRAALAEHYALRFASGMREALELAREEMPELLVTEVDLADGDGLALCADIRRQPQTEKLPIMLLTARASVQDRVAGYNAGADDYVVKPFDARLFHARIRLLARIKGIQTRES